MTETKGFIGVYDVLNNQPYCINVKDIRRVEKESDRHVRICLYTMHDIIVESSYSTIIHKIQRAVV